MLQVTLVFLPVFLKMCFNNFPGDSDVDEWVRNHCPKPRAVARWWIYCSLWSGSPGINSTAQLLGKTKWRWGQQVSARLHSPCRRRGWQLPKHCSGHWGGRGCQPWRWWLGPAPSPREWPCGPCQTSCQTHRCKPRLGQPGPWPPPPDGAHLGGGEGKTHTTIQVVRDRGEMSIYF